MHHVGSHGADFRRGQPLFLFHGGGDFLSDLIESPGRLRRALGLKIFSRCWRAS